MGRLLQPLPILNDTTNINMAMLLLRMNLITENGYFSKANDTNRQTTNKQSMLIADLNANQ